MKYGIPIEMLQSYLSAIRCMERSRCLPEVYSQLESVRETIHDEILKFVGTDRNDTEFTLWLASFCEGVLFQE